MCELCIKLVIEFLVVLKFSENLSNINLILSVNFTQEPHCYLLLSQLSFLMVIQNLLFDRYTLVLFSKL